MPKAVNMSIRTTDLQYIKLVASILSLRKNRGSSPVNYDYYNLHYLLVVS